MNDSVSVRNRDKEHKKQEAETEKQAGNRAEQKTGTGIYTDVWLENI